MASDFHAHKPKSTARTLVSCPESEISRYSFASLELHPWDLPEKFHALSPQFDLALTRAAALGEVGLDKLRGPALSVQQAYLNVLLSLAQEQNKPVVIHCVKAAGELLATLRNIPKLTIMIHGFRGCPEQLEMWRKHGFFVSLSPRALQNNALIKHLRSTDLERIGFESDDTPEPIESILEQAAKLLDMPYASLEKFTDATFDAFFQKTAKDV
ncbi:MAG: TatD family hydrolase [Victivallales bacterium]|jgi:TatD DNase family protein|nr:TatD family hydrolase [Victivallales bacterium]